MLLQCYHAFERVQNAPNTTKLVRWFEGADDLWYPTMRKPPQAISPTSIRRKIPPLPRSLNSNGVRWLGGNFRIPVPLVKYIVKISHKGLLFWSYSSYQKDLSDKVLDLRDRAKLTFNGIAQKLILEGYRSPRGFDLGPESVFSIYKKRNIRDARMNHSIRVEVVAVEIEGDHF